MVKYLVSNNIIIGDIKAAHEYLMFKPPIAKAANPDQITISKNILGCLE